MRGEGEMGRGEAPAEEGVAGRAAHISGVGDHRLGDGLADGVDLRRVAATLHADADVHVGEALAAEEEDRLEHLVPQRIRLHQLDRAAVDLDQAAPLLAVRDGGMPWCLRPKVWTDACRDERGREGEKWSGETRAAGERVVLRGAPLQPLPRCFARGGAMRSCAIRDGSPAAVGVRARGDVALATRLLWAAPAGRERGRRAPFSRRSQAQDSAKGCGGLPRPSAENVGRGDLREAEEAQLRALSLPALRAELDGALRALSMLKASSPAAPAPTRPKRRRSSSSSSSGRASPPRPLGEFALILIKHRESAEPSASRDGAAQNRSAEHAARHVQKLRDKICAPSDFNVRQPAKPKEVRKRFTDAARRESDHSTARDNGAVGEVMSGELSPSSRRRRAR